MLTHPEVICWQNFSIVESPDPFGAGAYNFQSISAVWRNRVWLRETKLTVNSSAAMFPVVWYYVKFSIS